MMLYIPFVGRVQSCLSIMHPIFSKRFGMSCLSVVSDIVFHCYMDTVIVDYSSLQPWCAVICMDRHVEY